MSDRNTVLMSAIYVPALNLTPEEKQQESAKFKAWYDSFQEQHGEELKRIRAERETWE